MARVVKNAMRVQIVLSIIDLIWCQSLCTKVQRFGQATGVVEALGRISNSIGYSGISGVLQELLSNKTEDPCRIKLAVMVNKAGETVQASIESAQSAVRSHANALLFQSACPGFGMCADVLDAEDYDAWPITAMTVSGRKQAFYPCRTSCGQ
jgi:ABC-type phosphate transport system substrate-binding protein